MMAMHYEPFHHIDRGLVPLRDRLNTCTGTERVHFTNGYWKRCITPSGVSGDHRLSLVYVGSMEDVTSSCLSFRSVEAFLLCSVWQQWNSQDLRRMNW